MFFERPSEYNVGLDIDYDRREVSSWYNKQYHNEIILLSGGTTSRNPGGVKVRCQVLLAVRGLGALYLAVPDVISLLHIYMTQIMASLPTRKFYRWMSCPHESSAASTTTAVLLVTPRFFDLRWWSRTTNDLETFSPASYPGRV